MSQYHLGLMYAKGEGVPENDYEAVKWIRRAAEQGLSWAQFRLGEMYRDGEGAPKDEVEAYAWFLLVKERVDEKANKDIETLEKRLTAEQRKAGRARAAKLNRKIPRLW